MKSAKRTKKLIILIICMCAIIVIAIMYYLKYAGVINTDDAFITGQPIYISSQVSGNVTKVHIVDNQYVKKGDLLVEINPDLYANDVKRNQVLLDVAEANYKASLAKINMAKSMYEGSKGNLDIYDKVIKSHAVSFQKWFITKILSDVARAYIEVNIAESRIAQIKIDQQKENLEHAKILLGYTKIYAQADGRITCSKVKEGNYLQPGSLLFTIVTDDIWVTANFKETELSYIHKGMPVNIKVDAYPNTVFKGHVNSFQSGTGSVFSLLPPENATGNYIKVIQRVPVKIVFDKIPNSQKYNIFPGMSVCPYIRIN